MVFISPSLLFKRLLGDTPGCWDWPHLREDPLHPHALCPSPWPFSQCLNLEYPPAEHCPLTQPAWLPWAFVCHPLTVSCPETAVACPAPAPELEPDPQIIQDLHSLHDTRLRFRAVRLWLSSIKDAAPFRFKTQEATAPTDPLSSGDLAGRLLATQLPSTPRKLGMLLSSLWA